MNAVFCSFYTNGLLFLLENIAANTSKNYTGSKTVNAVTEDQKPGTPMISSVKVVGNKATAILSGDSEGAAVNLRSKNLP